MDELQDSATIAQLWGLCTERVHRGLGSLELWCALASAVHLDAAGQDQGEGHVVLNRSAQSPCPRPQPYTVTSLVSSAQVVASPIIVPSSSSPEGTHRGSDSPKGRGQQGRIQTKAIWLQGRNKVLISWKKEQRNFI